MSNKAVVLVSGGIDSATTLGIACRRHEVDEVIPVHIQYGQQTADYEGHMAHEQVENMRALYVNPDIENVRVINYENVFRHFAEGVASGRDSFVTEEGDLLEKDGRSTGYVPMRNLHLIATAAAIADHEDASTVYHGAQSGDSEAYPDCRGDFMEAAQKAIARSVPDGEEINLSTPILNYTKPEVIEAGESVGVNWKFTYSCYESISDEGDATPCGECPACEERVEAFEQTDVDDPYMEEA